MSDLGVVFVVLAFIYLSDCFVWVAARGVLICRESGQRWKRRKLSILANDRGSLLLQPILPWSDAFLTSWPPVAISPDGVSAVVEQNPDGVLNIRSETGHVGYPKALGIKFFENQLILGDRVFATCSDREQARQLADLISKVGLLDHGLRAGMITNYLNATVDCLSAEGRLDEVRSTISSVRLLASVHFIFLFGFVPLMIWWTGSETVLPSIAVVLAITVAIARSYWLAQRKLYPDAKFERIAGVIRIILCPPVASRCSLWLQIGALNRYSPFVANGLLSDENRDFLKLAIRDLFNPIRLGSENEISEWFIKAFRSVLFCSNEGIFNQLNNLSVRPPGRVGLSQSYCPRCHCQFERSSGECSDCSGVRLITFYQATP